MRIAVNTRLLLKNKLEGIGWFSFETLSIITKSHPEHEFFFLFDRAFCSDFVFEKNVHPMVVSPPTRHPLLWYIWFELKIPKILKEINADIFVSPDGFLSLNSSIPSLAVIHDLNFEHHPKDLKISHRLFYRYFFKKYAHKANQIATVSEYSKKDICRKYKIHPSKIDVCLNGVSSKFHPIGLSEQIQIKKNYSNGLDYFLIVGALHPRKNISRLLQAFDAFKQKTNSSNKLLLVGDKMWWNQDLQKSFENISHKEDITFMGRKSQLELNNLYASALALCFVPYFEGFGIPILEAMKCACPVIVSNCSSMPEVAGDAAILVNPLKIEEISHAMYRVDQDNKLRSQLSAKGQVRAEKFSWNSTADALWKSIKKIKI
jgi:glycosyltransferase involved in cell wall biosynthesis